MEEEVIPESKKFHNERALKPQEITMKLIEDTSLKLSADASEEQKYSLSY